MNIPKELADCVNNLQAMDGEIQGMCNALDFIYNKSKSHGEDEYNANWSIIMGTLASGIVLRIAAFLEEIDKHFLKYGNSSEEIDKAIKDLKDAFSTYDYETLRHAVLAHPNRIREKGKQERIITFHEILNLVPPQKHTEYMKFGELTHALRLAMIKHFVPTGITASQEGSLH